jgi:hypothetical protein
VAETAEMRRVAMRVNFMVLVEKVEGLKGRYCCLVSVKMMMMSWRKGHRWAGVKQCFIVELTLFEKIALDAHVHLPRSDRTGASASFVVLLVFPHKTPLSCIHSQHSANQSESRRNTSANQPESRTLNTTSFNFTPAAMIGVDTPVTFAALQCL